VVYRPEAAGDAVAQAGGGHQQAAVSEQQRVGFYIPNAVLGLVETRYLAHHQQGPAACGFDHGRIVDADQVKGIGARDLAGINDAAFQLGVQQGIADGDAGRGGRVFHKEAQLFFVCLGQHRLRDRQSFFRIARRYK
jgi:hypothetical protein